MTLNLIFLRLRMMLYTQRLDKILSSLCLFLLAGCAATVPLPPSASPTSPASAVPANADSAVHAALLRQILGPALDTSRYARIVIVRRNENETAASLGYQGTLLFVESKDKLDESLANQSYLLIDQVQYQGPNAATVEVVKYLGFNHATGSRFSLQHTGDSWNVTDEKLLWTT